MTSCSRAGWIDTGISPHAGTRGWSTSGLAAVGLNPANYGTHSLRRTKVSVIYKRTGNLRAVQILLGHTKLESTARYLGVDIEDALTLAEATDI